MACFIPVADIEVGENRIRKNFENIADLSNDIVAHGLLHAVALEPDTNRLVAGERRIRAIRRIYEVDGFFSYNGEAVPPGCVPCVRVAEGDPYALKEIELHENLLRENLSWQERNRAIAELHELRAARNPRQTRKATASEVLGREAKAVEASNMVTNALMAKDFLDDPDIANCSDEKTAMRKIKRKLEGQLREALAEQFIPEESEHRIMIGDCLERMNDIEPHSVDCVVTDPPYGIGAQTFGEQGSRNIAHNYDDSYESWKLFNVQFAHLLREVCAPLAHAYIFCDIRLFAELGEIFEDASWSVWPTPLFWYKGNQGILPRPDHGPRRTYETIMYAMLGDKQVVQRGGHDILSHPPDRHREHAAGKPVSLFADLLSRSCLPGDTVLDPCCGGGPVFPAASLLSLRAIGIEKSHDAFLLAQERMAQAEDEASELETLRTTRTGSAG